MYIFHVTYRQQTLLTHTFVFNSHCYKLIIKSSILKWLKITIDTCSATFRRGNDDFTMLCCALLDGVGADLSISG